MSVSQLVFLAQAKGYKAIALSEIGNMFSAMEFYLTAKKANIKPILGVILNIKDGDDAMVVSVLAKNLKGYQHLCALTSKHNSVSGCSLDDLKANTSDCVIILSTQSDFLQDDLHHQNQQGLLEKLNRFTSLFNHAYLAISHQENQIQKNKNAWIKQLLTLSDVKTVALPIVEMANKDDLALQTVLSAIAQIKSIDDPAIVTNPNAIMPDVEKLLSLYDIEDIEATDQINQLIQTYELSQLTSLPIFKSDKTSDNKAYLKQLCQAGLKKRLQPNPIPENYQQRLQKELDVILTMNFQDYFLIVWDIIVFAKSKKIPIGPGRGSAAGSLVSYCLGITHVDPIAYDLLFERFLNPDRISMPDIDIDFADNKRDLIFDYVNQKYGNNHVANIITFGTFGAKASLRDVAKAYKIDNRLIDSWSKLIPNTPKITLKQAISESSKLKAAINEKPIYKTVFELAQRIEGYPRHVSTHAAGIVLSQQSFDKVIPTYQLDQDHVATQYSMEYLESLGLIKIDLLGLRNLTIIDEIIMDIDPNMDILKIPLTDKKTFDMISAGDTAGVFQLESEGMKRLIVQMQPTCFEDIVATIALYRPGPMENIPLYLKAKANSHHTEVIHPMIADIVKPTYGVLIYQEQIMQTVVRLANFSLAKADITRKAMSKKNKAELELLKHDFIQGCIENGLSSQQADVMFGYIEKFANYGFNKSHSVAYAFISYQMAYLKANAPYPFYKALLNGVIGSTKKTIEYIDECRRKNITIKPPHINYSYATYVIEDNGIRFPFTNIKGIGAVAIELIEKERELDGPFIDFYDFVARMLKGKFNSNWFEALIYAGALDIFDSNRLNMIASLDDAIVYGELVRVENNGQASIDLNLVSKPMYITVKENKAMQLEKELDVLGFYLSDHPILAYKANIKQPVTPLATLNPNQKAVCVALISSTRTTRTKKGEMMAFCSLTDESGTLDALLWPNTLKKLTFELEKGMIVKVFGTMQAQRSLVIESIEVLS